MASRDLTLEPFFWRATRLFPDREIISRTSRATERYTYREFGERVRALAGGLAELGIESGDRVGTFGWNHHRHFEAYFAVPLSGAQLHTVNVALPDDHAEYIVNDADDDLLLVDPGEPFETVERLWDRFEGVETVVIMDESVPETDLDCAVAYESLLDASDPVTEWPDLDEDQPAGMCYTSGTTGKPKGVEYTQKMVYSHAMAVMTPAALDVHEDDTVMHVVPMYHVNGWELPYTATIAGTRQVYPGPSPEPADLARLIEEESVTLTAGVPTVWINLLDYLDEADADLTSLDRIVVGGSAAPEEVTRRYRKEYDVTVEQAWGMTETMSIGSVSRPRAEMNDWSPDEQAEVRAKQGLLAPGLQMRIVGDDGEAVAWDGEAFGELWVRGPTVVEEYHNRPDANAASFEGDWLKTGDIASVDEHGYIEVVDRAKDVIKSGGEWISSIELENALIEHDAVIEAAVVAADHDRWQERPVAYVNIRKGAEVNAADLRTFLAEDYPRWWLPDTVEFTDKIPKTATGKFDKKALRDRTDDVDLAWTPGE
ncbi:o-succinylbenzoate--CoA ligase (plasmid) [halophilic archaeon DL31]|nr:o-succinylbenzoate--CoA ligase [halophilic archaeon DL31]